MNKKVAALLALTLVAGMAHAEDYASPTEERVRLSLGFEYLSSSTDVRIDSSTGVAGTYVNGEDTFGLDKHDFEPKFQLMLRVGERNRVFFDYFTLSRNGNASATQPILFRDVELQPGDPLDTDLSISVLSITYAFSFIHDYKYELAATLGVNDTDISARVRVNTATRHVDQTEDQAGPFPTIGLMGTWEVSKRFYLDGRAQYLKLNIDDLQGTLGFYELDALYRLRPNISFALGYNLNKAQLVSFQKNDTGLFDFDTKGPELFVRVAF